uniref:Coiled-coil domain containing 69 n=1 Tax=Periophthalmus magnuspinnatus TaxID=409849 RepID=A0A3B3ZTT1_9GOBI
MEKQLEKFEWQLRTLKEVLSANGNAARAELLKGHAHEEVCALVNSILDKVKTETTADLNVSFEQKSKATSEEHERRVEGQVEALTSELQVYNELKRRVKESTLKRDLKRNIQGMLACECNAHGSPGAFWESEQESLLFVIEMKAEQVEEHRRRLQQMDTLKNQSLEEQLVQELQQNEDLRVRFDNCQSFIRQLSKEQQELKLALDPQLSLNQRLSQEKEQLVFKIRHRDSYPSMHLSA